MSFFKINKLKFYCLIFFFEKKKWVFRVALFLNHDSIFLTPLQSPSISPSETDQGLPQQ
jgi:hypothetical protein